MQVGIVIALLSAVLFGASTPFAKLMLGNVSPWILAGLLYLGAGGGLVAVHLSRKALQLPAVEAPFAVRICRGSPRSLRPAAFLAPCS